MIDNTGIKLKELLHPKFSFELLDNAALGKSVFYTGIIGNHSFYIEEYIDDADIILTAFDDHKCLINTAGTLEYIINKIKEIINDKK